MSKILQKTDSVTFIRADFITNGMVISVRSGERIITWMNQYTFKNYTGANNSWLRHRQQVAITPQDVVVMGLLSHIKSLDYLIPLDKVDVFVEHLSTCRVEELPLAMFARVWINRYYELADVDHEAVDRATRNLFELAIA